jgi:hypothetical protein
VARIAQLQRCEEVRPPPSHYELQISAFAQITGGFVYRRHSGDLETQKLGTWNYFNLLSEQTRVGMGLHGGGAQLVSFPTWFWLGCSGKARNSISGFLRILWPHAAVAGL